MLCGSEAMNADVKALLEARGFVEGSNKAPGTYVVEKAFDDQVGAASARLPRRRFPGREPSGPAPDGDRRNRAVSITLSAQSEAAKLVAGAVTGTARDQATIPGPGAEALPRATPLERTTYGMQPCVATVSTPWRPTWCRPGESDGLAPRFFRELAAQHAGRAADRRAGPGHARPPALRAAPVPAPRWPAGARPGAGGRMLTDGVSVSMSTRPPSCVTPRWSRRTGRGPAPARRRDAEFRRHSTPPIDIVSWRLPEPPSTGALAAADLAGRGFIVCGKAKRMLPMRLRISPDRPHLAPRRGSRPGRGVCMAARCGAPGGGLPRGSFLAVPLGGVAGAAGGPDLHASFGWLGWVSARFE